MAMNASLAQPQEFERPVAAARGTRGADPLRAARGAMLGCAIGATLWAGIIAAFVV